MEVSYPKTTTSLGSAFGVQLGNRKNTLEKGGRGGAEHGEHEKAPLQSGGDDDDDSFLITCVLLQVS